MDISKFDDHQQRAERAFSALDVAAESVQRMQRSLDQTLGLKTTMETILEPWRRRQAEMENMRQQTLSSLMASVELPTARLVREFEAMQRATISPAIDQIVRQQTDLSDSLRALTEPLSVTLAKQFTDERRDQLRALSTMSSANKAMAQLPTFNTSVLDVPYVHVEPRVTPAQRMIEALQEEISQLNKTLTNDPRRRVVVFLHLSSGETWTLDKHQIIDDEVIKVWGKTLKTRAPRRLVTGVSTLCFEPRVTVIQLLPPRLVIDNETEV